MARSAERAEGWREGKVCLTNLPERHPLSPTSLPDFTVASVGRSVGRKISCKYRRVWRGLSSYIFRVASGSELAYRISHNIGGKWSVKRARGRTVAEAGYTKPFPPVGINSLSFRPPIYKQACNPGGGLGIFLPRDERKTYARKEEKS